MDKAEFKRLVKEWSAHLQSPEVMLSSHLGILTDCDAYREIVSLGYPALPLIIDEMRKGNNFLWFAVRDITGVKTADISRGENENVTDLYLWWWDKEGKYEFGHDKK